MYTQCPNCQQAFRVTAEILQQASGRVRCGSCAHVFDALDGLSGAVPHTGAPGDEEERSFREVFEALDDGGNIRIEDTGVEWRVVEEETGTDAAEERYDDNTPLPGLLDHDEDDTPAIPEMPRRRAEDFIEPRSKELDERQVDFVLGEPEEWTDLLEEVGDTDDAQPAGVSAQPDADEQRAEEPHSAADAPDTDADPTAEHPVFDADALALVDDDDAAVTDEQESRREPARDSEEDLAGDDIEEELELVADEDAAESADATGELEQLREPSARDEPSADNADTVHRTLPPTEEEMTIDRLIDQDLLRLTGEHQDLAAMGSRAAGSHVETIVMEGELVRSSLHGDVTAPEAGGETPLEQPAALKDTYIRDRDVHAIEESRDPARYGRIAAAVLLALALTAQLVHAHRETLATYDVFNGTLGAVYRQLGAPITPDWNVNGWQFNDTSGSTDASDSALTISSRIANRSQRTLPYPLLHVTLTDRYEEVVGSELLEPAQYLAIRSARGMVDPGEDFTAAVTIAPLSPDATGFKLNVCYPIEGARVRCATGAFKR